MQDCSSIIQGLISQNSSIAWTHTAIKAMVVQCLENFKMACLSLKVLVTELDLNQIICWTRADLVFPSTVKRNCLHSMRQCYGSPRHSSKKRGFVPASETDGEAHLTPWGYKPFTAYGLIFPDRLISSKTVHFTIPLNSRICQNQPSVPSIKNG